MRLVAEFEKFLVEEVNLNNARIDVLVDRVTALQRFLPSAGWGPRVIRFSPQGSWAHKTIIKPPGNQGFDADVVVFIDPVGGWSAEDYVSRLKDTFRASAIYREKVHLHTRCVRLEYAGDFEIDVVPCLTNRPGGTWRYEVCNRSDGSFEATDGEAYTAWLSDRNDWVGNDYLREVARLLKYLRDIKATFSCKSILLTTLLGVHVAQYDSKEVFFPDLPTALRTLVGRLDEYLQARPQLHDIVNPVLPREKFNRHWDEDKYSTFRGMIKKYRSWIDDAYGEVDQTKSIAKWRMVFGDAFGKGSDSIYVVQAANAAPPITIRPGLNDAVTQVRLYGQEVLDDVRRNLPWMQAPPWVMAQNAQIPVQIRATLHNEKEGPSIQAVGSGAIFQKHKYILFEAYLATGQPIASVLGYQVQWQVVNTDRDAYNAKQLRGAFDRSDKPGKKWEYTQYRGIHWVQAFLLRKRDSKCVGVSDRFFVVIE